MTKGELAAVAGAVTLAVAVAVGVKVATTDEVVVEKVSMCARQPLDGGVCLMRWDDGGTVLFGPRTTFSAERAAGQCAVFVCPDEP